jgi:acetylornithine aminotransferase
VEFNNVDEFRSAITPEAAGVVLEFIQGEGGIRPVSGKMVSELDTLRKRHGFLLVADEIQSGVGRTGKFFGYQHFNIQPDIAVLAKPIGGGLPLGAILGSANVADVLEPGMHGTTFGGNPVACAMGVATLREIVEQDLMRNAEVMGQQLRSGLLELQTKHPSLVKEVRGCGLMLGMELTRECQPVVDAMRDRGILINGTDQTVLRFLPPLIVTEEHIAATITALADVLPHFT